MTRSLLLIACVGAAWVCLAAAPAVAAGNATPAAAASTPAPDTTRTATLKVGDPAPDFSFPKPDRPEGSNETIKLSDLKGKKNVLVAFYPKAFTSGCTTQMCGYRDDIATFRDHDTEIVAVSLDEQPESDKFRKEHGMPFAVLGDHEGAVVKAYGIPLLDMGGKTLAKRSVVLVDKEGVVRYIDTDYDIAKDKEPLYAQVAQLSAPSAKKTG